LKDNNNNLNIVLPILLGQSKLSISLSLLILAMNFLKLRDRFGFIIFCYLIVNSINFNYLIFRFAYVFKGLNFKISML
jgi:hypothetical protein